jgi:hypothetical protein
MTTVLLSRITKSDFVHDSLRPLNADSWKLAPFDNHWSRNLNHDNVNDYSVNFCIQVANSITVATLLFKLQ